jgi:hypothetical protein
MLHRFGATSLKVAVRDTDLVVPSSAARCGGAVALLQLVPSKLPTPLLLAAVDSRGRLACSSFTAVNVDTFFSWQRLRLLLRFYRDYGACLGEASQSSAALSF